MDESAMLAVFHRAAGSGGRGVAAAVEARADDVAAALGSSGHRLMVMRSQRHPVVVASGAMRARPVIRLVGGGRVGQGPDREEQWQVTEVFTFATIDRLRAGWAAFGDGASVGVEGAKSEVLGARVLPVAGREPEVGDVGMCFTLRRRDGVERGEMQRMWLDEHAPLVLKGERAMGFDGYVQAHSLDLPQVGGIAQAEVDAVGFLTFRSMARMAVKSSLPGALVANVRLVRDEPRFIHPPATTLLLGTWTATTDISERSAT